MATTFRSNVNAQDVLSIVPEVNYNLLTSVPMYLSFFIVQNNHDCEHAVECSCGNRFAALCLHPQCSGCHDGRASSICCLPRQPTSLQRAVFIEQEVGGKHSGIDRFAHEPDNTVSHYLISGLKCQSTPRDLQHARLTNCFSIRTCNIMFTFF